jgi:hypothetical protein
MPLPENDIESELSYAYLHAVSSRAGLNCKVENRHGDNYGIDAQVDFFAPIPGTWRSDVSLRIQLKATKNRGAETATHISYPFRGIEQYNRLRTNSGEPHRILVVLFLPTNITDWVNITEDELLLKQAAYWVCLYGAVASANEVSQTIYLPKANLLTPDSLSALCQQIGVGSLPNYNLP